MALGRVAEKKIVLMSSFASKLLKFSSPHFPLFSSSPLLPSFAPRSTSLPFQRRSCRLSLVRAQESDAGDSSPPDGNSPKSRRDILLEYVTTVQPEFMKLFMERAPKQVVDAMRQTVANMIGTLPPQFFQVTVTTVAENLAQLMYSVMMTGYMFRNAQYRLELQQSLEQIASLEKKDNMEFSDYAPGTQKKVTGEVIKWNKATGPEKVDAVQYIEFLEAEVEDLRHQLTRSANGRNELLEYLKSLEPQNLQELTNTAGEDVIFAMNAFIKRLLGVSDPAQMQIQMTQTTTVELANVLYWLMVVGYSIRNIEVRFDMERVLDSPSKLPELRPGKDI